MNFEKLVEITEGTILNRPINRINKIVTDTRELCKDDVFIPLKGKVDGIQYTEDAIRKGASVVFIYDDNIKSYISLNNNIGIIKIDNGLETIKKLAKYKRNNYKGTIIGITGSNGKTTTKELLFSALSSKYKVFKSINNYNNMIGITKMLLEINDEDIAIFELGMNHLNEIKDMVDILKPNIGIITNIGTAHIGNLGSKENILNAKMEITSNDLDILFLNNEDDMLKDITYKQVIRYDTNIEYNINNNVSINYDNVNINIDIMGKHNISNIMGVISICKYLSLTVDEIKIGLENFKNVRMNKYYINNCLIIDDSYNANIESMKAGIDYVNSLNYENKILVLGDMLELGLYSSYYHKLIGEYIRNTSINKVYTYGNESKYIGNSCQKISNHYIDKGYLALDLKADVKEKTVIYLKASHKFYLSEIISKLN